MPSAPIAVTKSGPIIFVSALSAFLATFNETFLNVALAPIAHDFGIKMTAVQWLSTGYMLAAAIMIPVTNFLYRRFHTKPLFLTTITLLIVGSVIGALAPNFEILLFGRIVQAIGTGMVIPIGMNLTLAVSPREKLGQNMGIMGAMTTLGPSISIIISGAMLEMTSWRNLMWVFAALSAICFIFGATFLRNISGFDQPILDVVSVFLIAVGLTGVLYGISSFAHATGIALGSFVIGLVVLWLFWRRQQRAAQPLLDVSTLRVLPFTLGVLLTMTALTIIFAMNIVVPIYLQTVLGKSSLYAAGALAPAILLSAITAPIAGKIYDKKGPKIVLPLGFSIMAVAAFALAFAVETGNLLIISLTYIPVIIGASLVIGNAQTFALSQLPRHQNPDGVTVVSTGFQVAGAVGASLFIAVFSAAGFRAAAWVAAGFAVVGVTLAIFAATTSRVVVEERTAPGEPTIADLMKTDVYTVPVTSSVFEALQLFVDKGISGAPLLNADASMAGFISDGDIMRYIADQEPTFSNVYAFIQGDFSDTIGTLQRLPVTALAHQHVVSVDVHEPLARVTDLLADHGFKKVPVVDDGRLVGIVNRSNVSRFIVDKLLSQY